MLGTITAATLVVFGIPIICLLIWYYYQYFTTKTYLKGVPCVEQYPLVGSALLYPDGRRVYQNALKFATKYGRVYWAMFGPLPLLFVSDVDLLQDILSSTRHINKPSLYKVFKKFAGNGLVTGNGNIWRIQRKLLTPTFHFKILEQFMVIFNRHTKQFLKALEPETLKKSVDVFPFCQRYTLGQATETVMGLKSEENAQNNDMYLDAMNELTALSVHRIIRPWEYIDITYRVTSSFRREQRAVQQLDDYVYRVIQKKEAEYVDGEKLKKSRLNDDGTKEKTVTLDLLIENNMDENVDSVHKMSQKDFRDQVQTIMLASVDTSARAISYVLYNMAKYPDVQAKVYKEVRNILHDDPEQDITTSQIQEMKYLDLVIKESMRLYSNVPFVARELDEDVKWNGITLPKGMTIAVSMCALHMDEKHYPEPEKFIPERFTAENIRNRHPYAYLPFSAGPRNCIGMKYGMQVVKTCLARLVMTYEFTWVNHELDLAAEIVLVSKSGVKVGIKPRKVS